MNDWKTPEFVEVRMDAEINCYSSALNDNAKVSVPNRPVAGESDSKSRQS